MKTDELELPSNRKFGLFFTGVFFVVGIYSYVVSALLWTQMAFLAASVMLAVTIVNDDWLLPANKLWMRVGLLLGLIISPVVLGILFFLMFTPISIVMRVVGRDELRLRVVSKPTHWIEREDDSEMHSFKQQF